MAESPNQAEQLVSPAELSPKKFSRVTVRLDKVENPFDVPQAIKDEVMQRLANMSWSKFPVGLSQRLAEKLAVFTDWKPHGILVGNGSSELLEFLLETTSDGSTRILTPEPSLGPLPALAERYGIDLVGVRLTESLQFNIPKLCSRAVAMKADLVFISSPHDPAGCVIAEPDLAMLLKTSPGLVVVNEAFHEFARTSFASLLKHYSNLVILRSFSIALGMAGLRVGYLMASPHLVQQLGRNLSSFRLNLFSATAAEVAIERFAQFRALIEKIIAERERLYQELRQLRGVEPVPSHANFMILRTALPASELCELLGARGVVVHDLSRHAMLANSVRVTIGSPTENERLVSSLKDIFLRAETPT